MVHCNLTLINNLLFTNWNVPELKQILLVNYDGYSGYYLNFWYGCPALQGILALALDENQPKKCPLEAKELYSYQMQDGHRPFPVSILNFPISLPEIDRREPHSKWCFAPSYLKSNREGLVDVSTFDHLTSNLDLIRNHFAETGFTQEYLGDIEKALEGRKIRRLKILGYYSLAKTLHFIQQIAFVLNIKDTTSASQKSSPRRK
ncbi:hypothetical protein L596_026103 [Steinernema carpocapsae]|uniref:Uncharacterized protein n=1 Tax=Steinernema carpocapsae TaxID=34508 RepID=A0A4U5M0C6_STECR|nr:hypothetical protein L596_026103 [Steinernema carpocapsae]